jgi:Protein of unknown function (DUF3108)/Tetratricopeptide repeat
MKTTIALRTVFGIFVVGVAAAIYAQTSQTTPESPSELLEKGIYNQDTKGDFDSAIGIYQQVVAEASSNQQIAAHAQFRLGQCYLKKNRPADATAAFEKLIHDFPNEKALIAQAREYLPGALTLGPIPWVDGERMQLNISVASGTDIGTGEYCADLIQQANGGKIWRVGCRMMAGPQSVSSVDVDSETFRPISSHWKHSMLGEVTAVYSPGQVQVQRVGRTGTGTTALDGVVYDNEEAVHVMRRLPLQVGYKATVSVFASLGAGTVLPVGLEVIRKETVEVPAGKFDCLKVHLSVVNQDFWFSNDIHRYLVKFEAGPITAVLMSVTQRRPGGTVAFHDDETRVSFTVPADWVIFRAHHGQPEGQVLIRTLDPDADTDDGGIRLFATDTLSELAQKSAGGWMTEFLQKSTNIKVRPDSWKELTIDGRPAVSCVGDHSQGGESRVYFLALVLGAKNSELFVIACAPGKYDALKPQFDAILTSYRTH